jgi:hypothetical protein
MQKEKVEGEYKGPKSPKKSSRYLPSFLLPVSTRVYLPVRPRKTAGKRKQREEVTASKEIMELVKESWQPGSPVLIIELITHLTVSNNKNRFFLECKPKIYKERKKKGTHEIPRGLHLPYLGRISDA